MTRLVPIAALAAAGGLLLAFGAGASPSAGAAARAWGVQIVEPGKAPVVAGALTTPHDAVSSAAPFSFPADGSIVSAGSTSGSVSAVSGARSTAGASEAVTTLSLFGGEIAADTVTAEARSLANGSSSSGEPGVTGVDGLTVFGRPLSPAAGQRIALGDWGYAIALEETGIAGQSSEFDERVTALDVVLTADHGGLPAGSEIQIGYAEAWARSSAAAVAPAKAAIPTITVAVAPQKKSVGKPPTARPKLGEKGYVFPVYGTSAFGDTFGSARPDVSGGWHHGDDIFAPLGAPLLAVAHGIVFSVGWERVGGWRLWLRDDVGNDFYYAHLSAYSPLAVNGAIVNAGDVLGFVGDSGDAEGTPYHLHFEVHPVGMLERGYDGAVDPTSYLRHWRSLKYLRVQSAAGWTPRVVSARAPKAGAILLQSTDISAASGLDPAALSRVLTPRRPAAARS